MNDEELQKVVEHIQREDRDLWTRILRKAVVSSPHVRSLTERRDEALLIQASLGDRIGCPVTEVQVETLWERFSAEHMSRWWMVDEGTLALCARWILQEVYRAALGQVGGPADGP